ncbi:MAG TPA: hypothetical protein VMU02_05925 [bacterium]|nr:hypothetical protein [bacterium]
MKRLSWQVRLGILLVLASAALYVVHYAVFRDAHGIFFYLLDDVAFVPIQVLLVTLIIAQLLGEREKRGRLEKLSMVIGAFFSVVGTRLLTYVSDFDPNLATIRSELVVRQNWTDREFAALSGRLKGYNYSVDINKIGLEHLRDLLTSNRDFMVRLLENPTLLEHATFTSLLRAVFHVTEELESRPNFTTLPETDFAHLAQDIKRGYGLLVSEWVDYMQHLKNNYPYLFSLAMRTNPFDQEASPIVRK